MDLNSLTGKELDKYGESQGISRYQGLGLPEDDESYRKSIRQNLRDEDAPIQTSTNKQIFHMGKDPVYGVLVIDPKDGLVIRVASKYQGNGLAVYDSVHQAKQAASEWSNHDRTYKFEVREIKLFEG